MLDRNRYPLARRGVLFGMPGILLIALLGAGCASEESTAPTPSSNPRSSPSTASAAPGVNASRAVTPAGNTSPAVAVDPVSPEEFQKYIAGQRGKVVFVDFWATYCLPCREKFPHTLALAKKYANRGLSVVSMSMDSPEPSFQKQIVEFLTKQNSQIKNFANRLEDTDAAFAALDIVGGALPHYKIYGRDGKLQKKFGGDPDHPYNDADVEQALVIALREGTP
jgi:thiol-disulfide isomerase/thioredoxin